MGDEQVTCDRHKLHSVHEGGADWVVYRRLSDEQWPGEEERYTQHIETATEGEPLFCIGCGQCLRADGTVTARCDVVTPEAVRGTDFFQQLSRCVDPNNPASRELVLAMCVRHEWPVIHAALSGGLGTVAALSSLQAIAEEVPHDPACDGKWAWNGNAGDVWSEGVEYGEQIVRDKLRAALAHAASAPDAAEPQP